MASAKSAVLTLILSYCLVAIGSLNGMTPNSWLTTYFRGVAAIIREEGRHFVPPRHVAGQILWGRKSD